MYPATGSLELLGAFQLSATWYVSPVPLSGMAIVPLPELLLLIVSCPAAAPEAFGSNCTFSVAVWPDVNVSGNVAPDRVNPLPLTDAELTVTAALPVDVNVTTCVAAVFTATLPKEILVAFTLSVGTTGANRRANVAEAPPPVAVSVALCDELTATAVAVKAAFVALATTVTEAGTVTAVLLLARLTLKLEDGAAVNVTVHASDPAPVIEALVQEILLTAAVATPAALMFTTIFPWDELLAIVKTPVNVLTCGEVNCSASVAVCPGLSVTGTVTPAAVNNDPTTVIPEIVTGAVPVELRITDWDAVCPVATLPKFTLVALTVRVETAAFNCRVIFAPPVLIDAVSVAACAEGTEATVAVKTALVALLETVTVDGTVTAALLLARLTTSPPLGAAALNVTVQLSVLLPVIEVLAQLRVVGTMLKRSRMRQMEAGSTGCGFPRCPQPTIAGTGLAPPACPRLCAVAPSPVPEGTMRCSAVAGSWDTEAVSVVGAETDSARLPATLLEAAREDGIGFISPDEPRVT